MEKLGNMNIPFSEVYNKEDDVYYVTFKTGEPSYCAEVDDILIMEFGLFTNLPTGFRILNFSKNRVNQVRFNALYKKVQQTLDEADQPNLSDRKAQIRKALEEVLI